MYIDTHGVVTTTFAIIGESSCLFCFLHGEMHIMKIHRVIDHERSDRGGDADSGCSRIIDETDVRIGFFREKEADYDSEGDGDQSKGDLYFLYFEQAFYM